MIYSLTFSKANRNKISNSCLLPLSIADILYCLIYPSYLLPSLIDPKINAQGQLFCKVMTFLSYSLGTAGIMAITALPLDRYTAIKYSFVHQRYKTARLALFINLVVYIYPLACFTPIIAMKQWANCFGTSYEPSSINWHKVPKPYLYSLALLFIFVPGVILAGTNVHVFVAARKRYLNRKRKSQQIVNTSLAQTGKLNQVSDTNCMKPCHESNRDAESSRENRGSRIKDQVPNANCMKPSHKPNRDPEFFRENRDRGSRIKDQVSDANCLKPCDESNRDPESPRENRGSRIKDQVSVVNCMKPCHESNRDPESSSKNRGSRIRDFDDTLHCEVMTHCQTDIAIADIHTDYSVNLPKLRTVDFIKTVSCPKIDCLQGGNSSITADQHK